MSQNSNLSAAKKAKNDEFYTLLSDIEKELVHYKEHFKGKVVYCNCDDAEWSQFWKYFELCFEHLGLKKLIATHYDATQSTYKIELTKDINGDGKVNKEDVVKTPLNGNGDFRSEECIEILKEADIVVSNPPFSHFRQYVAQLIEYDKKFLILGNTNAITYKEIFPLIKDNKLWLGYNCCKPMEFVLPANAQKYNRIAEDGSKRATMCNISWYTNLPIKKRNENLILFRQFDQSKYPMFDNYLAFNVDKVNDIPINDKVIVTLTKDRYDQLTNSNQKYTLLNITDDIYEVEIDNPVWGVPITFLSKFNSKQFEIVEFRKGADGKDLIYSKLDLERERERVQPYFRILVRRVL